MSSPPPPDGIDTPLSSALGPAAGAAWRTRGFEIIFGHDDAMGRAFDVALIVAIVASIVVALLDSVASLHADLSGVFYALEWAFTLSFTLEYLVRLAVVNRPRRYACSFFGVVDLLSILPTYISLLLTGSQYLLVVRALRILRIFRVLKLTRYVGDADFLWQTLLSTQRKILIFVSTVLTLVLIFGTLMYLIEGPENGFTSIPLSMYWAVVTMTTVGFGDIAPKTPLVQLLTSLIVLVGYGIIVVPMGIFTAELAAGRKSLAPSSRSCDTCGCSDHDADARCCKQCGARLPGDD